MIFSSRVSSLQHYYQKIIRSIITEFNYFNLNKTKVKSQELQYDI